ncbi:uncharacterized protein LOC119722541 [Patiria miniata]|uniref:Uncharacterized protein n=1 Tax=Patiria miniata TaxID=46514 RepID=A0A913ZCJ6_PATMI|nr:uncharacterized protein LOC119722541 [Patiria miniata]
MPRACCVLVITGVRLFMLLLVTSTRPVAALVGTLTPVIPIIEVGSDMVLTCTLNNSSNDGRTTQDVIWKHNTVQLSPDMYASLSDTVSQLTLTNVTFNDSGNYYCLFPEDGFFQRLGLLVRVGMKPEPPLLECFIRNPDEYRCRWEDVVRTNLRTMSTFAFWFGGNWTDCPPSTEDKVDETCFIPIAYNTGTTQRVRVTSRNALGVAYTERSFNPILDVVVNPPRDVRLLKIEDETSLSVTWHVPNEWPRMNTPLDYKIRYKRSNCGMAYATCWTEATLRSLRSEWLDHTLRDLAPYTVYDIQIAARYGLDEKNWSEWTETVSAVTREILPTATVQGLQVNTDGESLYFRTLRIFWEGVPQEQLNGKLHVYEVRVISDEDQTLQLNTSQNSEWITVEDLQKFKGYYVKVAARNGAGLGPWKTESIPDLTKAPNAPDEVRAVALTTTSIFVSWDAPSQPNGYIERYTIEWGTANEQKQSYSTPDARRNHTIEGLKTFALYEVSVKVKNSRGWSGFRSVPGGIRTIEGVPDAPPTDVEVKQVTNQPERLTLMWQRPRAENINGNLTGYRISFCESSPFFDKNTGRQCAGDLNKRNVSRPDAVSDTLTKLAPSTSYLVWIAAYTAVGLGPDSQSVHAETAQETKGILVLAIVVPILIVTLSLMLAIYIWKRCRHVCRPVPDPKFLKEIDLFKNDSQRLSRSSSRMEEEHFDEILPSQNDAIIIGLMDDKIELAKEASQMCPKLQLSFDSVSLDPKTQTARFMRSESRDSGVPPSPASESPDFSTTRDRLSSSEEGDDNVFLEEEENPVGAYTRVGQFIPSKIQTPKTSQSSPVKSPKKVSFEIPPVNDKLPLTSPTHKLTGVQQNASQGKQNQPHKSMRSSSCSSMDVSPYTQMSALESLQCALQQTNQPNLSQSNSTARTSVQIPSSSPSVVSPYTQISTLASLPHQQQQNRQSAIQPPPQLPMGVPVPQSSRPVVAPYTQMSAMESLQPNQQQNSEDVKKLQPDSPDKSCHTPKSSTKFCSPYTQMSALASLKSCQPPNSRQQEAHQPRPQPACGSPNSPPAVSPYTKASIMESSNPRQQEAHQPKPNPASGSPSSPPTVSPYTQVSLLKPPIQRQQEADQLSSQPATGSPNSPPAVSPYTKASIMEPSNPREQEAHQPKPNPPSMFLKPPIQRQQEADQLSSQPATGSPNSPPAVSPYTKASIMEPSNPREQEAHQPKPNPPPMFLKPPIQRQQEADQLSSQPATASPNSPPAVSPYTKASIMEPSNPRQQEAHQPKPNPASGSPSSPPTLLKPPNQRQQEADQLSSQPATGSPNSPPAVSPYTQVSLIEPPNASQQDAHQPRPQPSDDQTLPSKSPAQQAVSSYIKMSENGEKPIQNEPMPPSAISPYTKATDMESMQPREDQSVSSGQPHQISGRPSLPPQSVPSHAVSPYTKMSDMKALHLRQEQSESSAQPHPISESPSLSSRPFSPQAASSYIQSLEIRAPQPEQDMQHQLPSVISTVSQSLPEPISAQAVPPYTKLSDMEAMQPRQDQSPSLSSQLVPPQVVSPYTKMSDIEALQPRRDQSQSLSPQHFPVPTVSPYTKMSKMAPPSNLTSYNGRSEIDAVLQSQNDEDASLQSPPPHVQQSLQPSASNALDIEASGYCTGASVPKNVLSSEPGSSKNRLQNPPRQDLSGTLNDNQHVTSAVDPNETSPGFLLTSGSTNGHCRMQETASSRGFPSISQPSLESDSDSDDEPYGYSKMSARLPNKKVLGSGSDQSVNAADQASDPEVTPYSQIGRNEELQPSSAPPQINVTSTPLSDNPTVSMFGYVAGTHDSQEVQSIDAGLNSQDDPSEVNNNVADYTLVAAVGSQIDQAAVRDVSSADNHSDDSGFDNEADNTPPQSLLSDYVQIAAGTHGQDGNTPLHPAPTANSDIGNQLVTAASDTQPIADYVVTGSISHRTDSQA